jgi:hypothetical protein
LDKKVEAEQQIIKHEVDMLLLSNLALAAEDDQSKVCP